DLAAERKDFYKTQRDILLAYDSALVRWRRATLSDADFVRTIAEDVLPRWRMHAATLRRARRATGTQGAWVKLARSYIELRDRYWCKVMDSVRSGSRALMDEAVALDQQAN